FFKNFAGSDMKQPKSAEPRRILLGECAPRTMVEPLSSGLFFRGKQRNLCPCHEQRIAIWHEHGFKGERFKCSSAERAVLVTIRSEISLDEGGRCAAGQGAGPGGRREI